MVTINRPLYTGSGFRCLDGNDVPMFYTVEVDSLDQAIYDLLTEVRAVLGGPGSTITQMLGASAQQQQAIYQYTQGLTYLAALTTLVAPEVGVPLELGNLALQFANQFDWGGDLQLPQDMPASSVDRIVSGDNPVTPVTPPPAGYGGGASASDVWGELLTLDENTGLGNQETAAYVMRQLLNHHLWAGQYQGWTSKGNPLFRFFQQWTSGNYGAAYFKWTASPPVPPNPDWTTWNGTDDVVTFLNAAAPGNGWSYTDPWGATSVLAWSPAVGESTNLYWRCEVLPWQLPYLSGRAYTAAETGGHEAPPVWPGLANVTLGTPVPIATSVTVPGPLHGILLAITLSPSWLREYQFGGTILRQNVGGVTFESDGGDFEAPQVLGFESGLYCPKTMSVADSARAWFRAGTTGTVIPWTRAV